VRSLGFQPEPSSHDWHVQPSCQRTDPLPPERTLSVQSRFACVAAGDSPTIFSANLPVLETCTNYASCALTVNPRLAQDIHLFSTARGTLRPLIRQCPLGNAHVGPSLRPGQVEQCSTIPEFDRARSKTLLPPGRQHSTPMPFRHQPRRKSISLKKDHLEVSANNAFNPSRNLVPE
jgi:hypothetical protein